MLKHQITAGTEEKSDVRITVSPGTSGREIIMEKIPHPRFCQATMDLVNRILDEMGEDSVQVRISDFGALEFVIEARLRAAVKEARRDATC